MPKAVADLPLAEEAPGGFFPSLAQQTHWARTHGPIYRRQVNTPRGPQTLVILVGPEANRFVLHTGRENFSHAQGWTPVIGEWLGQGLLNMDPPAHTRQRKLWNPAFSAAAIEAHWPMLQQVIAAHTARWAQAPRVDVAHEARALTFEAVAVTLAGLRPGAALGELQTRFAELLMGGADEAGFWAARRQLDARLLAVIAERRAAAARPDEAARPDVLSAILHAQAGAAEALTDAQLLGHLNILLVAGHETTTSLAAWVLYLLATQPEHRQRLIDELAALTAAEPAAGLSLEVLRRAAHLDRFVQEAGRLYAPVVNVPRGVLSSFAFEGHLIPPGTQVRLALAAGHRLPQVFADPERFDPDRFAPPREEHRRHPYALVTFGGGARTCIGMNFALLEVKALAAHVLRHYHLEALPGQSLAYEGYWTAFLPDGLWLSITPRT